MARKGIREGTCQARLCENRRRGCRRKWLYEFMGVIIGSGVCPLALAIMSRRANKWGCTLGAIAGLASGLIAWLVTASALNGGVVTIDTTFQDYPMLSGNLTSIGIGAIVSVGATLLFPENYEFVREYRYQATARSEPKALDSPIVDEKDADSSDDDKLAADKVNVLTSVSPAVDEDGCIPIDDPELDMSKLAKSYRVATISALALFVVMILIVPLPLALSHYIYPMASFYVWVIVGFIWAFVGAFIVILYPIYESRAALINLGTCIINDIKSGGKAGKASVQ